MKNLNFEIITNENIEQCKDLCNELMSFQKSKAVKWPEFFDGMNFETRLKSSLVHSPVNHVIVAKDGDIPIGYVFSTIEDVNEGDKSDIPEWVPRVEPDMIGFYPNWENFPKKVGCLNHLYFRADYRSCGLGSTLLEMALEWLESFDDVDVTFVYISNGNDAALQFYLRHGFIFSHDVFGGFIYAAYKYKTEKN